MKRLILCMVVVLMVLGCVGKVGASTIIDTATGWNGTSAIYSFSGGPGRAFGQSFVVGGDNVLDSFAFYVDGIGAPFLFL